MDQIQLTFTMKQVTGSGGMQTLIVDFHFWNQQRVTQVIIILLRLFLDTLR